MNRKKVGGGEDPLFLARGRSEEIFRVTLARVKVLSRETKYYSPWSVSVSVCVGGIICEAHALFFK